MPDDRTDRELVNDILGENEDVSSEAWNEFFKRFQKLIYSILIRNFRFPADVADDVFQEVCCKLVTKIDTWQDDDHLSGFVATATKRAALDKIRWSRSRREEQLNEENIETPGLEPSPEENLIDIEEREGVEKVIKKVLTGRDLEILRQWLAGFGYQEIAANHGITVNNVGVILRRSRQCVMEAVLRLQDGGT